MYSSKFIIKWKKKTTKNKPQILIKQSHSYCYRIEKFSFHYSRIFIPEADCIFAIYVVAIEDDQVIFHTRSADWLTGSFRVHLTRTMKSVFLATKLDIF